MDPHLNLETLGDARAPLPDVGVCSCIPTGAARLLDAAGEGMR